MNEFTKEELEKLKELVVWDDDCIAGGNPIPIYGILVKKIQSLIDNYCEHTPSNFYTSNAPSLYSCQKCGDYYR